MTDFLDWVARLPWGIVVLACLTLGLAPFTPEPHIVEKLRLLAQGALRRPLDVFDLLLHATPFLLLFLKLALMARTPG